MYILGNSKLSDSTSKIKRTALVYLLVSIFCFVFFLVYDRFSHNVRSNYMTFLFAWPLLFGFVPYAAALLFPKLYSGTRLSSNLYNSGVACVTVSSLLRGIFDIAGTYSDYQTRLMAVGIILLTLGALAWVSQRVKRKQ